MTVSSDENYAQCKIKYFCTWSRYIHSHHFIQVEVSTFQLRASFFYIKVLKSELYWSRPLWSFTSLAHMTLLQIFLFLLSIISWYLTWIYSDLPVQHKSFHDMADLDYKKSNPFVDLWPVFLHPLHRHFLSEVQHHLSSYIAVQTILFPLESSRPLGCTFHHFHGSWQATSKTSCHKQYWVVFL